MEQNIFINIHEINFINQDYLIIIDELYKSILRNSINTQFQKFKQFLLANKSNNMIINKYNHILHIEEDENPLEHILINVFSNKETMRKNPYNCGIIDFLINIGFTQNVELIKKRIEENINIECAIEI
jgi:hypothetical protein